MRSVYLSIFLCFSGVAAVASEPPIYQMSPSQLAEMLPQWQKDVPALGDRVVAIARRNLGQPYELYLLGEAPFETIDAQPIFCIEKSDCVVFVEHTLAMALSDHFPQFLAMLQRIRYRDGEIGVQTRNHYTEADWNVNNRWLLREITDELDGVALSTFSQKVNRQKFFKDRYKLDTTIAVQQIVEPFIRYEKIGEVQSQLRNGDVVNFVSGVAGTGAAWVGHVGLVTIDPTTGAVNLLHSASPSVREEPIGEYIARATKDAEAKDAEGKARFIGFKFLRLTDDPWSNLRAIDGESAPKVTVPSNAPVTWEQFVDSVGR
ncbi:MAG TPA: DUF1460 domain-containing protein [Tepidisphaeraceae bacterium]|nr:DUF1460 domain-containing protein [Tepidisphaeraceae bacterium]